MCVIVCVGICTVGNAKSEEHGQKTPTPISMRANNSQMPDSESGSALLVTPRPCQEQLQVTVFQSRPGLRGRETSRHCSQPSSPLVTRLTTCQLQHSCCMTKQELTLLGSSKKASAGPEGNNNTCITILLSINLPPRCSPLRSKLNDVQREMM